MTKAVPLSAYLIKLGSAAGGQGEMSVTDCSIAAGGVKVRRGVDLWVESVGDPEVEVR